MEHHANSALESQVHTYLVFSRAYPREALQSQAAIGGGATGRTYRADIAVMDTCRREIVALIEVKGTRDPKALRGAVSQLLEYRRLLEKPHLPLFLFFPRLAGDQRQLEIAQVLPDGDTKQIHDDDFPAYEALVSGDVTSRKANRRAKVGVTLDTFHKTCIWLAVVTGLVLIADIAGWLELTTKQLVLAGIGAALLILPFTAKLKLLGVEFERHIPKERSSDETI